MHGAQRITETFECVPHLSSDFCPFHSPSICPPLQPESLTPSTCPHLPLAHLVHSFSNSVRGCEVQWAATHLHNLSSGYEPSIHWSEVVALDDHLMAEDVFPTVMTSQVEVTVLHNVDCVGKGREAV